MQAPTFFADPFRSKGFECQSTRRRTTAGRAWYAFDFQLDSIQLNVVWLRRDPIEVATLPKGVNNGVSQQCSSKYAAAAPEQPII